MSDGTEPTGRELLEFMAPLMEQSARDLAWTTGALIDFLAMECAESAARLQLIGEAMDRAYAGGYVPSEDTVRACLYPSAWELRERTLSILRGRGIHSSVAGGSGDG